MDIERKPLLADAEKHFVDEEFDAETDDTTSLTCGASVLGLLRNYFPGSPLSAVFKWLRILPGPGEGDALDITHLITFRRARPFTISPCSDLYKQEHKYFGTVVVRRIRFQDDEVTNWDDTVRIACRRLASVQHENVLEYLGVCMFEGSVCIVSPFVDGGDLKQYLQTHQDCDMQEILSQIASGLAHLHDAGIVHGNLHSRNVLITKSGKALLSDFGLNELIPDDGTTSMRPAFAREKALHRAPETHLGARMFASCDVYSFGMLAFAAYCDAEPMVERYPGAIQVAAALLGGRRPQRGEITRGDFSERMWATVQLCWAHEILQRPSMRAAVYTLEATS